jgi:hypothetical protein
MEPAKCIGRTGVIHMSIRSVLIGSLGFAAVSVAAFSLWAFGGRWFHSHGGDAAMYSAIAAAFLVLSGVILHTLIRGGRPLAKFYGAFVPAFFAYAVLWCLAWFVVKGSTGEWLGSFFGSFAFAAVVTRQLGGKASIWTTGLLVFIAHSIGYFMGGKVMYGILGGACAECFQGWSKEHVGMVAKLGWGLLYGLGFGAGIGMAFDRAQQVSPVTP